MPVYVDNMRASYGRMKMCHLLADSMTELFEMADRIGVARKWFQPLSHPHFDIALSKKALAIQAGAIEVDRHGIVEVMKRYRARLDTDAAERVIFNLAISGRYTDERR